jgi:hypothetical protein
MTAEDIALIALVISTLVTIIGWGVTARLQHRILIETNKAQRIEREVAVFRERLATVRTITTTLIDQMSLYAELVAMALTGTFNLQEGGALIKRLNEKGLELVKALYDPQFRAIRDLLPEDRSKLIYDQLKKATDLSSRFHADAVPLGTAKPITPDSLLELATRALDVSREFTVTANLFADAFAVLDSDLASGRQAVAA